MDCRFSLLHPHQLLTVERPAAVRGPGEASWVDTCVHECTRDRLHRLSATRVPLPSHPVSCSRHPGEAALLLGLGDSSLVLHDQRRGVSLLASCPAPPNLVAWHPAGAMAVVGGGRGELMCFDVGLAPISMALVAEELAPAPTLRLMEHLRGCEGIERLQWGTSLEGGPEGTNILVLVCHGGPLAALRFRLGMCVRSSFFFSISSCDCGVFRGPRLPRNSASPGPGGSAHRPSGAQPEGRRVEKVHSSALTFPAVSNQTAHHLPGNHP